MLKKKKGNKVKEGERARPVQPKEADTVRSMLTELCLQIMHEPDPCYPRLGAPIGV